MTTEKLFDKFYAETIGYNSSGAVVAGCQLLSGDPTLKVYVRKFYSIFTFYDYMKPTELKRLTPMLDIVTAEAEPKGTGRFTKFLEHIEKLEPFDGIQIVNVMNPRLVEFFRRRPGYIEINRDKPSPSFFQFWDGTAFQSSRGSAKS